MYTTELGLLILKKNINNASTEWLAQKNTHVLCIHALFGYFLYCINGHKIFSLKNIAGERFAFLAVTITLLKILRSKSNVCYSSKEPPYVKCSASKRSFLIK